MQKTMDKDEFDEVLIALGQIGVAQREYGYELELLNSDNDDEKIRFKFERYTDSKNRVNREAARQSVKKKIAELNGTKEAIIRNLEIQFSDTNGNIRRYLDGRQRFIMTNPYTGKKYGIDPKSRRVTLYYLLLLERRVNNGLPVCTSDYIEMENYFKTDKCTYPKELFAKQ